MYPLHETETETITTESQVKKYMAEIHLLRQKRAFYHAQIEFLNSQKWDGPDADKNLYKLSARAVLAKNKIGVIAEKIKLLTE